LLRLASLPGINGKELGSRHIRDGPLILAVGIIALKISPATLAEVAWTTIVCLGFPKPI
jgi:hypothetical protein